MVKFIGEHLLKRTDSGEPSARIATVFPAARTVVALPEVPMHAYQRTSFLATVIEDRAALGKPPLTDAEQDAALEGGVDLFVDERGVLIRPDPARMDLAIAADELLQEAEVPKDSIKYLLLSDHRVRDALKRRGESWRMFQPPTAPDQVRHLIASARAAIGGRAIYYYSPVSGTRFLTCQAFRELDAQDDAALRRHLVEIATYAARRNANGCCEIEFFMADPAPTLAELESASESPPGELRLRFRALAERIRSRVPQEYQQDDPNDAAWRSRMFGRLIAQRGDASADDHVAGLDPEFSMRVEWLPGGRIADGELFLDPALEQACKDPRRGHACSVVAALILNLVQEYGDLEYINIASVLPPANRGVRDGRREVYVAQIKQRGSASEVLQVIRMQKWGVRERLEEGDSLERALLRADEYTEYVLDRVPACRQLGMHLPNHQTTRKISEYYHGSNPYHAGLRVWTPYFQREYIPGIASNQVPARKLADPAYAIPFARLLGQAAATNLIVGRATLALAAIFDVGDEIVVEDAAGRPRQIVVSDHVGTFADWRGTLESHAAEYAGPVVRRLELVQDGQAFADAYLSAFVARFAWVQNESTLHRRPFDTLFKYRPFDPDGSLAFRWSCVLQRLRTADARRIGDLIRSHIPDEPRDRPDRSRGLAVSHSG